MRPWPEGNDFVRNHRTPGIDFASFHVYIDQAGVVLRTNMAKCVNVLQSESKSKKHGSIIGSDLCRNGLIRACDRSMLSAFAFAFAL